MVVVVVVVVLYHVFGFDVCWRKIIRYVEVAPI